VLRLQAQIGNAATGRLLSQATTKPATQRTLQRFTEAEHRALGDLALTDRFRLPAGTMFADLELSFGDWVALGDYFEDIAEIKKLLKPGADPSKAGEVYYAVLVKIRPLPKNKEERDKLLKSYRNAELWTQADVVAVERRYIDLAPQNFKHFSNPLFGDTTRRRASIKDYWDAKVPNFPHALLEWITDEVAWVIETEPDSLAEWAGSTLDALDPTRRYAFIRDAVREKLAPKLGTVSFGDLIGKIVHDWEGEHGPDHHGPLVTVAGHRFRTVGDGNLLKAVTELKGTTPSDSELEKLLGHKGSTQLDDAQRTFAGAELAVRRSVHDLKRAYELAGRGDRRDTIMAELQGKDGLFASERLLPIAVPDPELAEADRMPKWDFATVDQLLNAPKIHDQLPISASSLADRFDVNALPGSAAVKAHIRTAVVTPLKSGDAKTVIAWLHQVLAYSRADLPRRISGGQSGLRQDLKELSSGRR
jgi:hypothetical protein